MIEIDQMMQQGYSRAEAFTLVRDRENAQRGVTTIAYPSPEQPPAEVVPVAIHEHVVNALVEELRPYLSSEDIQRVIRQAVEGE